MVTKEILSEIRKAVEDPKLYSSGEGKNRLRAAFDAMTSQIYTDLFKEEPERRIDIRQKLNACEQKDHTAAQWKIIGLLGEAIRESETSIHAKGYSDHADDTEAFIKKPLSRLYQAIA